MVPVFRWASKARSRLPARAARLAAAALLTLGATSAVAASEEEALRGPDVTIIAQEERTIHEFRQNGELRMVRVVPNLGRPYYLVPRDPSRGFGDLERADMLVPSWVIVEF